MKISIVLLLVFTVLLVGCRHNETSEANLREEIQERNLYLRENNITGLDFDLFDAAGNALDDWSIEFPGHELVKVEFEYTDEYERCYEVPFEVTDFVVYLEGSICGEGTIDKGAFTRSSGDATQQDITLPDGLFLQITMVLLERTYWSHDPY